MKRKSYNLYLILFEYTKYTSGDRMTKRNIIKVTTQKYNYPERKLLFFPPTHKAMENYI